MKPKQSYLKFIIIFWILFLLAVGSIPALFYWTAHGLFGALPPIEVLENPETSLASEVWSVDGVLLGKYYSENRTNAKWDELPDHLVDALISTEDRRYYDHAGIDLKGTLRAITNLGRNGGGSTITQQLAKNLFHERPQRIIDRIKQKLKEWIIAVRLERCYTKKEIITMYLNTVEFSDNAWGIKSAVKTYFDKPLDSLTVEEGAVLIGMLQAPYQYNPRLHPKASKRRRNVVLLQMYKYGDVIKTKAVKDSFQALPIKLNFKATSHIEGLAPYFREYLRLDLQKWCNENKKVDGSSYNVYRDGLKIYTTIDSRMQKLAEEAVDEHMADLQKDFFEHWKNKDPWKYGHDDFTNELRKAIKNSHRYKGLKNNDVPEDSIKTIFTTPVKMKVFSWEGEKDTVMSPLDSIRYHRMFLQTGFLVVDPKTGFIKAWVGGINYKYFQFDHVQTRRQIGSTFKPFLYATAIDDGWSPCHKVLDVPITIEEFNDWTPQNADGVFTGKEYTLKQCLAESKNSCSAYLIDNIPPSRVIETTDKLGITSHIDPYPSICLGTPDITLYEMVGAYTAFANNGLYSKPVFLSRIEDKNGNVIEEFPPQQREALRPQTNYIMVEMLKNVIREGTGKRLWLPSYPYQLNNEIGGKTGTTQNHSDGWFIGITPNLIAGAWVGGEDRFMRFRNIRLGQGANMALPIWAIFFKKVYASKELDYDPSATFDKPDFELTVELDCSKYEQAQDESQPVSEEYGSDW